MCGRLAWFKQLTVLQNYGHLLDCTPFQPSTKKYHEFIFTQVKNSARKKQWLRSGLGRLDDIFYRRAAGETGFLTPTQATDDSLLSPTNGRNVI